jgi:hypothetical protein
LISQVESQAEGSPQSQDAPFAPLLGPKHWQIDEPPDPEPARQPASVAAFAKSGARNASKRVKNHHTPHEHQSRFLWTVWITSPRSSCLTAVIVRTIGRRVGPATSTRMAMDAHLTTSSEGPAFDYHHLRRQRLVEHNAVDACDGR